MKKAYITTFFFLMAGNLLFAQQVDSLQEKLETKKDVKIKDTVMFKNDIAEKGTHGRSILKFNVLGLVMKNYHFQAEAMLGKRVSILLGYRIMPFTSMPFKNQLSDAVGITDPDVLQQIDAMQVKSTAMTPEIRIYVGKRGWARGFYVAPFYRYAKYSAENIKVNFSDPTFNSIQNLQMTGTLISRTFGLTTGIQFFVTRYLCFDWWIMGPHYGSSVGYLNGNSSKSLNTEETSRLQAVLDGYDIPMMEKNVRVNQSGATVDLKGNWAGIRTGFAIGLRF
ncbi:MAG: DUF3575 domain-containing protein [Chitinophagaceae bacterium]